MLLLLLLLPLLLLQAAARGLGQHGLQGRWPEGATAGCQSADRYVVTAVVI
jgi:hypothetical protein